MDRARTPFLDLLEASAAQFLEESRGIPESAWTAMAAADAYQGRWLSLPLALGAWQQEFPGLDLAANRHLCPRSAGALDRIEGLIIGGFLRLDPASELRPHRDKRDDDVIRAHLALRLPPAEAARWPLFTARLIDIRQEHWAKNDSEQPRITMMVDVRLSAPILAGEVPPWND